MIIAKTALLIVKADLVTIEGQYIVKNLVIIGSALVIGATVRGGRVVSEPIDSLIKNENYNNNLK